MHNYFGSLTIEIVNKKNKGWFKEYQKEFVIAKYDIRLLDTKSRSVTAKPHDADGVIRLPLDEFIDHKENGMR